MTIPELITLMQNRIATLGGQRATAEAHGDVAEVTRLDAEITETQATLEQLRTL